MDNKITILMTAIEYPCGKGSNCCGPVGQKDEEIIELKNAIEKSFNNTVEIFDVKNKEKIREQKSVRKLINNFGLGILPLIVLNNEVVTMCTINTDEIISQLSKKINNIK